VRRWLAFSLVAILAVEIAGFMVGVLVPVVRCQDVPMDALKELMIIIFGPTVALVGSATGFYFGSHRQSGDLDHAPTRRVSPT
jgi:hypothetical protein